MVDDAREHLVPYDSRSGISADWLQADAGVRPKSQHRFCGSEECRVSRAARHELHLVVGLSAIGFETSGCDACRSSCGAVDWAETGGESATATIATSAHTADREGCEIQFPANA
jgi:hypothetical protein